MNELLEELNQAEGQVKALEAEALKHEAAARDCRERRGQLKLRVSEIRAAINDAKVVHAAQGSLAAAQAAQRHAEAMRDEAATALAAIREKQGDLDRKLASLSLLENSASAEPAK